MFRTPARPVGSFCWVVCGAAIVVGRNRINVAISKCAPQALTKGKEGVKARQLSRVSNKQLEARFAEQKKAVRGASQCGAEVVEGQIVGKKILKFSRGRGRGYAH